MTKKELIDFMSDYPDDALVTIEIDEDLNVHEELYDFTFDGISWTRTFPNGTQKEMHELRLCAINDNFHYP
jgi:hypothetical protein